MYKRFVLTLFFIFGFCVGYLGTFFVPDPPLVKILKSMKKDYDDLKHQIDELNNKIDNNNE